MKLSLIIPCYNEEKNIPYIFARLQETLGKRSDIEIVLVDNGSTDHSAHVLSAELAKANDSRLLIHNVPINKGYGYGIMSGLKVASGDVLSWTHADMQTDPKDVLMAFDLYRSQRDPKVIVKGRRQNRGFFETLLTWGMQVIASIILGVNVQDVNAQPKLFSREFFEQHLRNHAPNDFSLDLFLMYQANKAGYRILTIPVQFAKRLYGVAKGGGSWRTRIKLIQRTLIYIINLRLALMKK